MFQRNDFKKVPPQQGRQSIRLPIIKRGKEPLLQNCNFPLKPTFTRPGFRQPIPESRAAKIQLEVLEGEPKPTAIVSVTDILEQIRSQLGAVRRGGRDAEAALEIIDRLDAQLPDEKNMTRAEKANVERLQKEFVAAVQGAAQPVAAFEDVRLEPQDPLDINMELLPPSFPPPLPPPAVVVEPAPVDEFFSVESEDELLAEEEKERAERQSEQAVDLPAAPLLRGPSRRFLAPPTRDLPPIPRPRTPPGEEKEFFPKTEEAVLEGVRDVAMDIGLPPPLEPGPTRNIFIPKTDVPMRDIFIAKPSKAIKPEFRRTLASITIKEARTIRREEGEDRRRIRQLIKVEAKREKLKERDAQKDREKAARKEAKIESDIEREVARRLNIRKRAREGPIVRMDIREEKAPSRPPKKRKTKPTRVTTLASLVQPRAPAPAPEAAVPPAVARAVARGVASAVPPPRFQARFVRQKKRRVGKRTPAQLLAAQRATAQIKKVAARKAAQKLLDAQKSASRKAAAKRASAAKKRKKQAADARKRKKRRRR